MIITRPRVPTVFSKSTISREDDTLYPLYSHILCALSPAYCIQAKVERPYTEKASSLLVSTSFVSLSLAQGFLEPCSNGHIPQYNLSRRGCQYCGKHGSQHEPPCEPRPRLMSKRGTPNVRAPCGKTWVDVAAYTFDGNDATILQTPE